MSKIQYLITGTAWGLGSISLACLVLYLLVWPGLQSSPQVLHLSRLLQDTKEMFLLPP